MKTSKLPAILILSLAAVFLVISTLLLRSNNLKMGELRSAVVTADKDAGDTSTAIQNLKEHVEGHMNTAMGAPIELGGDFAREVQRLQDEYAAAGGVDTSVYDDARTVCEDPNIILSLRAECVQNYVLDNSDESGINQIEYPPKEDYTYKFNSPVWSPDAAGLTLVASGLLALTALGAAIYRKLGA